MQRKYFFLLLSAVIALYMGSASAQENRITLGVGLGLGQLHYGDDSYLIIQPKVGYRFNDRLAAGLLLRIDNLREIDRVTGLTKHYRNETDFSYGGYVDYTPVKNGSFSLLVSGRAMHIRNVMGGRDVDPYGTKKPTNEFGVTPGVKYSLKKLPLEFTLNYLFLGYMDYADARDYKNAPGCWGSRWVVDAGLRRLEIGAAVTF